jgi:hypothetical protein
MKMGQVNGVAARSLTPEQIATSHPICAHPCSSVVPFDKAFAV